MNSGEAPVFSILADPAPFQHSNPALLTTDFNCLQKLQISFWKTDFVNKAFNEVISCKVYNLWHSQRLSSSLRTRPKHRETLHSTLRTSLPSSKHDHSIDTLLLSNNFLPKDLISHTPSPIFRLVRSTIHYFSQAGKYVKPSALIMPHFASYSRISLAFEKWSQHVPSPLFHLTKVPSFKNCSAARRCNSRKSSRSRFSSRASRTSVQVYIIPYSTTLWGREGNMRSPFVMGTRLPRLSR
jgi:hypothetical protein